MTDLNVMSEKIKDIMGAVPRIKSSYDHEPQNMSVLPASTLFFDGFTQNDSATRRKTVNWRWLIRIYIPIRTSDIKQPQEEIRNLVQDSIKQLRSDPSLGGTCLYHNVSSGEVSALLEQSNPLLLLELTLEATTGEEF